MVRRGTVGARRIARLSGQCGGFSTPIASSRGGARRALAAAPADGVGVLTHATAHLCKSTDDLGFGVKDFEAIEARKREVRSKLNSYSPRRRGIKKIRPLDWDFAFEVRDEGKSKEFQCQKRAVQLGRLRI